MQRVLFLTNYSSPYRVEFFDQLGKDMDVTVLYADRRENQTHREQRWFVESQGNFRWVQLEKQVLRVRDEPLCLDVIGWLKQPWDQIVVCGYSYPTMVLAMAWLRAHRKPFWMEIDGGLIREDSWLKYRIKRLLVSAPNAWLSTGEYPTKYLTHYGARPEKVEVYPFTSLHARDILPQLPSPEEKAALRRELGLEEGNLILSVGRFDHGKGFDVLLNAAARMGEKASFCIVGGEPKEDYLTQMRELGLTNVRFLGFQPKEQLAKYYRAADLFVLPTRSDVWGLVINEAMACGLPVVTTDRCVAGLELIQNGVNGYIVPVDDDAALADKLDAALRADCRVLGQAALETIRPFTIENMAKTHVEIFQSKPNFSRGK